MVKSVKITLEDRGFEVRDDEFLFGDKSYSLAQISHIFFSETQTTHRTNYIKTGEYRDALLKLTLADGTQFRVKYDEAGIIYNPLFKKNLTAQLRRLRDAYEHLSAKTFKQRVLHYTNQLRSDGFFVIDECRFYPPDKVYFRDKVFLADDTAFIRHPGCVTLEPMKRTLFGTIAANLTLSKIPQFNIQTDTDVCLFLLKQAFGISWKTEG